MHKVIYALVEASTQDDALTIGKHVFDRIVNGHTYAGSVFEYSVCFDREGLEVAGTDRGEDLPVAAPGDSDEGQQLLTQGWQETRECFEQRLSEVRQTLETRSDEELLNDVDDIRQTFRQLGVYEGPSVLLYNKHGAGIRTQDELDQVLAESDDLWIVPADVHY